MGEVRVMTYFDFRKIIGKKREKKRKEEKRKEEKRKEERRRKNYCVTEKIGNSHAKNCLNAQAVLTFAAGLARRHFFTTKRTMDPTPLKIGIIMIIMKLMTE